MHMFQTKCDHPLYSDGALVYRLLALGDSYGVLGGALRHSSSILSADFLRLGRP